MTTYQFRTRLKGNIALTNAYHSDNDLQKDKSLYKFVWAQTGRLTIDIDHVSYTLNENEIVPLTPLHHLQINEAEGDYLTLLFNSNFYCIYGHDDEVSCGGILFNGTSQLIRMHLTNQQAGMLHDIAQKIAGEYNVRDNLQEEMLRILLKRFIITCTRIAREKFSVSDRKEKSFDIVRQFYVLVDNHFKELKKVQDYADKLHRSPKTLSNLFSSYGLPSPLRIIHERTEAEAKRLLLYSAKSAKEIADMLGFDDLASFSRFFKNNCGQRISDYRKKERDKVQKQ